MTLEALKSEALKLPDEERADLADELIRSLDDDGPRDPDYECDCQQEIDRRLRAIEDGSEELYSAEEVYASIQAEFA